MKNSTSLKREHDFQGSGGSGNTTFLLFVGVWFLDWLGNRFLWILAPFWDPFCLSKSMKNGIDFGIDFRIDILIIFLSMFKFWEHILVIFLYLGVTFL